MAGISETSEGRPAILTEEADGGEVAAHGSHHGTEQPESTGRGRRQGAAGETAAASRMPRVDNGRAGENTYDDSAWNLAYCRSLPMPMAETARTGDMR